MFVILAFTRMFLPLVIDTMTIVIKRRVMIFVQGALRIVVKVVQVVLLYYVAVVREEHGRQEEPDANPLLQTAAHSLLIMTAWILFHQGIIIVSGALQWTLVTIAIAAMMIMPVVIA
jgi:hypothetical protein